MHTCIGEKSRRPACVGTRCVGFDGDGGVVGYRYACLLSNRVFLRRLMLQEDWTLGGGGDSAGVHVHGVSGHCHVTPYVTPHEALSVCNRLDDCAYLLAMG